MTTSLKLGRPVGDRRKTFADYLAAIYA